MADPDGPVTPADIAEMTRYATESRPPALRELEEATQCRCDVAWTSRNLHETHCLAYLRSEVQALYRAGVQAGREQEIQRARAAHRGGHDNTLPYGYQDGWEAGYIVGRADGRDDGEVPEVCSATTDLYGADIPCARSPGHRDPHQSHNPILTWGEDWRYEEEGDTDG